MMKVGFELDSPDYPAVAALDTGMDPEGKAAPEPGEAIGTEGRTVEEVQ
jgi:hypothetical protein